MMLPSPIARTLRCVLVVLVVSLPGYPAFAEIARSQAPEGAELYFIAPEAGAEIRSPVTVRFGLKGMGVAPAGVEIANTGHHHLLINMDGDIDFGAPLPANEQVVHFGAGQTETDLVLPPGTHRLRLVLGNYLHIPHDPPVASEEITITVTE